MFEKLKNQKIVLIFILALATLLITVFVYVNPDNKKSGTKENLGELYRIGFITDIHGFRTKKAGGDIIPESKIPLIHFVKHMNKNFKPDFVVQGGDLIEGRFREGQKSIDDFKLIDQYFKKLKMPHYHVIGNHETSGFSREKWQELTNNPNTYYHFDYDRLRVIILDGNDILEEKHANLNSNFYYFSNKQIDWLEQILHEAEKKNQQKIIFIHQFLLHDHPLGIKSKNGEKIIFPEHSEKVRKIIHAYKVNAVISGHIEKLFYREIDGVKYFSSPGIFKSKKENHSWLESFSEITLNKRNYDFKINFYYKKETDKKYQTITIPSEEFEQIEK